LDGRIQRFAGWTFLGITFSGPIENSCLAIYDNHLVSLFMRQSNAISVLWTAFHS